MFAGMLTGLAPSEVRAQGMPSMKQMEGMGDTKQTSTASATGTVTAVNAANHKVTVDQGPIPEIKWPAMKMEFSVGPSLDPRPADDARQHAPARRAPASPAMCQTVETRK